MTNERRSFRYRVKIGAPAWQALSRMPAAAFKGIQLHLERLAALAVLVHSANQARPKFLKLRVSSFVALCRLDPRARTLTLCEISGE